MRNISPKFTELMVNVNGLVTLFWRYWCLQPCCLGDILFRLPGRI